MIKAFYTLILILGFASPVLAEISLIEQAQQLKTCMVEVKTIYIRTIKTPTSNRVATYTRTGVGLILDASGIIVTNTHTIVNAPRIIVVLNDGTTLEAQVGYISNGHDFSFLKVNPPKPLKPISWADSSAVNVGDSILTLGAADLDTDSILSGKVTALLQNQHSGQTQMFETNLNLYKGNSGGPIINHEGRLIGIIMAKDKKQNHVSLAIASDIIHRAFLQYKNSL